MGAYFSNLQVFCGRKNKDIIIGQLQDVIKSYLAALGFQEAEEGGRTLVLCPQPRGSWLTIYDSAMEEDLQLKEQLTLLLSAIAPVVSISVQDNDCLSLMLADKGVVKDFFVSAPEYLDISPEKYWEFHGQPGKWASMAGGSSRLAKLTEAFRQENVFAEDQLAEIADLMGWDINFCLLGFRRWHAEGGSPPGTVLRFST